ncbi:hypothetical protein SeMB42_g00120 [Synchytrium endobioticum]|uniref:C3H1-type domain-containing protein n=1 Tax=Synchytrium endobioticum TaxID=286115 RepID=A0A507DIQ4_9FUNG|nr:hypothetical protein SeLEV6574_g00214 [Synchytrium endobioticum]TPX54900.1 hypothetical protein SeMB42_g00120 [Synchytrium endobioticum]
MLVADNQLHAAMLPNSKYKTSICRYYRENTCVYGMKCKFAHSISEIRTPPAPQLPHRNHRPSSTPPVHSPSPIPLDESSRLSPFLSHHLSDSLSSNTLVDFDGEDSDGAVNGLQKSHGVHDLPESPTPPSMAIHYKTRWCRSIRENGSCKYAQQCSFAHAESELRAFGGKDSSIFGRKLAELDDVAVQAFLEKKRMKRGMLNADRDISTHPLYKTRMCSKIDRAEGCDLGDQCRYAHSTSELRPLPAKSQWNDGQRYAAVSPWYGHASGSSPSSVSPTSSYPSIISPLIDGSTTLPTPPRCAGGRVLPVVYHPETYKTQQCLDFDAPHGCPLGKRCMLAHGPKELRRNPSVVPYSGKKCTEFSMPGSCVRGDLCGMAHGDNERTYHPDNYKTKLCTKAVDCEKWRYGTCPYIHTEDAYLDNPIRPSIVTAAASTPPPTPPQVLTTVKTILRNLGLEKYEYIFMENEIDPESFYLLSKDALKDLGVPYGPTLKILNHIRGLTDKEFVPLSSPLPSLTHSALSMSLDGERLGSPLARNLSGLNLVGLNVGYHKNSNNFGLTNSMSPVDLRSLGSMCGSTNGGEGLVSVTSSPHPPPVLALGDNIWSTFKELETSIADLSL